ncbi:cytochrome c oxidase subunit I [Arsenicitalea aurantiaca]|uniref:cytochrome-c oxidase n=1 Tax=Arsenicitalea aurantiaca TaxID=1783274 RepID=A0A433XLI3_9HYPH|nr:cytochrome c oxidase subunit I [Arsenicitalea aurantiaca]RUT34884.1 cytochrome c oxidase subunit I [Arsenicitalea aurantiaca]
MSETMEQGPSPIARHKALEGIWGTGPGLERLAAVNHNILGKRFMVAALVFFAIGGILSMLIRAQLATPNSAFIGPEIYNQIFTMHGTVMMFLFAIPMFEGLAMYLLPKMIGARDLAFPRLTAYGFWCYIFGGTILVVSMLFGVAPDSGWFMYTPLSSQPYTPGINADVWLLGVTFVEISAMAAAVEIIATILKMRAPGMSLDRMPIYGWYILVTAGMMLIGFPPLILGSILLEMERAFDLPFFDPTRGGDPLLWQHLFWLFGHPEVYIIFLPAAGALSTIIPVFARHPLIGYRAIVVAIIAMAFLSFGLWVHHMFTVGIPHLALAFFSAASALVAIPTAVQIFAWIATIAHGRPRFSVPMLYVMGFFFVFVIGGLTGVMLAMVPFNWQAHDTHFVVAHLHYVLVGGFVFPMLAAGYYWLPHITGRLPLARLSVPAFWLIFIGFNATFFLMHITGLMGMPRRIATYPSNFGWDWLNLLSSVGGFILTMGFALVLLDIIMMFKFGKGFRRDPWQAGTLEWATPTPPPSYNFAAIPRVTERADGLSPRLLGPQLARGEGYLAHTRNGWQETLGVDMTTGEPDQIIILPRRTYLPLVSGLVTAAVVLCMLFKLYWFALGALGLLVVTFLFWAAAVGNKSDIGPLPAGQGISLPLDGEVKGSPTFWGVVLLLAADATLFASLLFGALFLVVVAPGWPPPALLEGGFVPGMVVVLAAAAGAGLARLGRRANAANASPIAMQLGAGLVQAIALGAIFWLIAALPDPTAHAYSATSLALLVYLLVHNGIAFIVAVHAAWRYHAGFVSARRATDPRLAVLWGDYAGFAALVGILMLLGLPFLATLGGGL